jgi:hypothetical protein
MFTPKIVHDEEPDPGESHSDVRFADDGAELELPEDLTFLAGRLEREAALLADRYPAEAAPRFTQPEVRPAESEAAQRTAAPAADRGQTGRFLGPALALILAISAGAAMVWNRTSHEVGEREGGQHAWSVSFRPDAEVRDQSAANVEKKPAGASKESILSSPAAFVHELTGPEMEGLLDLLEHEDPAESRLSI